MVNQKAAGKDCQMGYQKATEMVGQMATEKDSLMVNQKAAGMDSEKVCQKATEKDSEMAT